MPTLVIGIGKPKGKTMSRPSMPPPEMPGLKKAGRMPRVPKAQSPSSAIMGADPSAGADQDASGIGPEDVGYSDNDLCGSCAHLQGTQCAKYSIPVDQTGHCEGGYEASGDAEDSGDDMPANDDQFGG